MALERQERPSGPASPGERGERLDFGKWQGPPATLKS